jgi:tripartite-type tricarboxylate transporter receptor subunit TctC
MRALVILAAGALAYASQVQAYPDKPIRLVVGFSAGGPTDRPARFVADRLATALGQRVLVENRPGAGGQIAMQDLLSKARDGYNLLLCTHFEPINVALYRNAQYKLSDIAPVSQLSRYYYGIAVTNEVPARTLDDFIAYAKANPERINYGMVGRGSVQEVLALELGKMTGVRMVGVPYKGGADIMGDLISGRIQLSVTPTSSILPQHKSGKLKVLAVTSPERLAVSPDIPTMNERGLSYVRFGWQGICAAAGTPQPIIALINREVVGVVNSSEYQEMTQKAGSVPLASTPAQLEQVLQETYEQTVAIIREFKLQQD